MAKGKHSAALFEVIQNAKRPEAAAQSMKTPKWWFKGRQAPDASTPASAPVAAPPSFSESEPAPSLADPTLEPRPSVARPAPARASAASAARSSAVHMDFDRSRQELTLRLRYTTALVSAFVLCVVIGVAYVIGRHMNHGPQTASASVQQPLATPQYVKQFPQAGVTDVTRQRLVHNPAPANNTTWHAPAPAAGGDPSPQAPRAQGSPLVPGSAETRLPRTIGLNYAIIQTYPAEEIPAAQAACDFLNKHGIPCTLEKTSYVQNPNWVCLVGTAGFTKISSGDYLVYRDNILALAEKFPSSRFNRFDPKPYKWRG